MADTIIQIDATAEQLEAAAKATHWSKKDIVNAIFPPGSLAFFAQDKTLTQVNDIFGTNYAWEKWGSVRMSNDSLIYVYHKLV